MLFFSFVKSLGFRNEPIYMFVCPRLGGEERMAEELLDKELERKLKLENLTRCCSCALFQNCKEPFKEDIVECNNFSELPENEQFVIVRLSEYKL